MTTYDEAIAAAGRCFAEGRALRDSLPVAEAARLAYTPTGPPIEELERRIAELRAGTTKPARATTAGKRTPGLTTTTRRTSA